jgi:hypothetical protein
MYAAEPEQEPGGGGGGGAPDQKVSFRSMSQYRTDPEYTGSGVRQYINEQLYPHLLAAMQAINTTRPQQPVMFLARCLLEGAIPEDEPTVGAYRARHRSARLLRRRPSSERRWSRPPRNLLLTPRPLPRSRARGLHSVTQRRSLAVFGQ